LADALLVQDLPEKRLEGESILKDVMASGKRSPEVQIGSCDWDFGEWTLAINHQMDNVIKEELAAEFVSASKHQLGARELLLCQVLGN
jgi:hypothetical protein